MLRDTASATDPSPINCREIGETFTIDSFFEALGVTAPGDNGRS